jgi:uncharacterized protein YndB with AHSA1/START domain
MRDLIRKALTRRISIKGPRGKRARYVEVEPSDRLVYGVYFAIAALTALTILEATYILVLRSFSSEVFSAITGLIGTIVGALATAKG